MEMRDESQTKLAVKKIKNDIRWSLARMASQEKGAFGGILVKKGWRDPSWSKNPVSCAKILKSWTPPSLSAFEISNVPSDDMLG